MTQEEFERLAFVKVSSKDYEEINAKYMESELDKYEFCWKWGVENRPRIIKAEKEKKEQEEEWFNKQILFRLAQNDSIENIWKSAEYAYSEREKNILGKYGITITETINGRQRFKRVSEIVIEIRKVLGW